MLKKLQHGLSRSAQKVLHKSDTSRDEADNGGGRLKVLSEQTYKMTKVYAADELVRLFVTGSTNASSKPCQF